MAGGEAGPRQVRAYFSHSYRFEDNRLNLHFWRMFSSENLYFAVDPPDKDRRPMNVTYLEWLMAQSACFVAVIPRRDDVPPPFCSPYQTFEYRLAVRARKPRLIFLDEDLEAGKLGIELDEVIPFRRWRVEDFRLEDAERATRFAAQVRQSADVRPRGARPIGLVTRRRDSSYDAVVPAIQKVIDDKGRSCKVIDSFQFESDYRLLQELEDCEVLVSEIRPPYVPADLYGLIHGRAFPTLRIAHLAPGETAAEASAALRLAAEAVSPERSGADIAKGWPILLSGYQVDPSMQPVIFWSDPEELRRGVADFLSLILKKDKEWELDTTPKAQEYFLRLGRLNGKVFLSNFHAQNDLAVRIAKALRDEQSIEVFHYTDETRDASQPNWQVEIRGEIELCTHFVALIDEEFNTSRWCLWETAVAVELFRDGKLELHTYKIGTDEIPSDLRRIRKPVQEIKTLSEDARVRKVVGRIVASFENGKRVSLGDAERAQLLKILALQSGLKTGEHLAVELRMARLPETVTERVLKAAPDPAPDLGEVIDVLASQPASIKPWKTALGMFLLYATRDAEPADRAVVWNIVRLRSLMPDVVLWIKPRAVKRELGLSLSYDSSGATVEAFTRIRNGILEGRQPAGERAAGLPLSGLVGLVAGQPDWSEWVRKLGESVVSAPPFHDFQEKYRQAVGPAAEGQGLLGLCIASNAVGLRSPVEWAKFAGLEFPLALSHPVRRYLLNLRVPRPTLRWMLTQGQPAPLRVLIVGAHTGDLPAIDNEIKAVRDLYSGWFDRMGWPRSDITLIEPADATFAMLEHVLSQGTYQVLHFAGHGLQEDDEPGLAVRDSAAKDRLIALPASLLAGWVERSDLRMIYLSSCRGAGEGSDVNRAVRRFESLAEALVSAGVPEVVGFRWPILDTQSQKFAQDFHRAYLQDLDASAGVYTARRLSPTQDSIWAAAVVIAQHDSLEG